MQVSQRAAPRACLRLTVLRSPAASYISGHTLVVDGAQWLHHRWVSDDVYAEYQRMREAARAGVQSKL